MLASPTATTATRRGSGQRLRGRDDRLGEQPGHRVLRVQTDRHGHGAHEAAHEAVLLPVEDSRLEPLERAQRQPGQHRQLFEADAAQLALAREPAAEREAPSSRVPEPPRAATTEPAPPRS